MNKNAKDVQFIFLPGIPGRKKDFGFITDLRSKNLTVIEYRHPGLYEEAGKFSVSNTIKKIKSLLTEMEKAKKPYVVIAYSFSSLIIQKMTIDKYKYLRGIVMFSPILGLGSDWISEDFDDTLKQLIAEGNCRPATNLDKEISELKKQKYDFDQLKKITACGLPICFFFSKNDTVINIKRLEESTQVFKDFFGQGSLFVIGESKGDHRIDTYYGESIRNLLLSFVAGEQVRNIVGDESYIFVWGSSQITNFFKDRYSDIDLYVLSNNYLKYFEELSILQSSFKVRFEVKLDLSINKIKDLFSEKISRFNRGPLLAHSLNNLYFNLGKRKIMIDVDFADVKQDCYKASLSIYRECEKQISRINGTEDQIRWFSKLFTVSIFYLLHVRGNKNVDMNNLERWLDKIKDKKKICLLRFAAKILAGGQKEMKKSDWLDLLEEMKKILVEEEKILDISYKTYPKKEGGKFEVINTPGKSKVVVSKYTKKVFKTYFLDSEEDARDKNRVIQHAKQLKFMGEHGINVPTNIKLIENESAIIMDYQDGVPLDKLIENENPLLKDIFNDLGDFLFKLHKILLMAPLADGFLVDDTELNYHGCVMLQLKLEIKRGSFVR